MEKKNKILWITGIVIVAAIVVLITINPFKRDVWDINADKLKNSFNAISGNAVIDDLSQWTPFEWDTLYSFTPYTTKDKIYEVIGYKWDNISETVNESMNQIVFVKDGKVVCYLYGYPENIKLGFNFGKYEGSHIKLTSEQKLSFETTISYNGVRYFYYIK
ncbi:hypothetical protein SAMN05444401_0046 [Clostridium amylolyticum]|uniref:Uncharacterized protein n=1 Tax=Clostridium amylolyticum TaxID=1121298 RepID=A0A1M6N1X3_9CLOT|nr:hypothetical protein [Clostridium amylolyticum]SHJ89674.1 hypothetical protein SAMN05444401_0046 [Clostridium amylolyticum]